MGARVDGALRLGRTVAAYLRERRPRGRSFDSEGVPIHYTDEGDGAPVVLVHGFAVNANLNWRLPGVTRALARDFRVISVDLRGHGRSGKPHEPARYGPHMSADIVRLLDHLRIDAAHIAGYSLGGFIALKLAAETPERLRGAAVLGAGWEPPGNSALLEALPRLADALEAGRGVGPISGNLGAARRKPNLTHRLWVKLMTRYFNDQRALIGVIRSVPDLVVTEAEVRAVTVPLCSIVGSRDPLIESAEALAGVARHHTMTVIDGADHINAPSRPELHRALHAFLRAT